MYIVFFLLGSKAEYILVENINEFLESFLIPDETKKQKQILRVFLKTSQNMIVKKFVSAPSHHPHQPYSGLVPQHIFSALCFKNHFNLVYQRWLKKYFIFRWQDM